MDAVLGESIVSSIRLRQGTGGARRVFIVQTRNGAEVDHAYQVFESLESHCSIRTLSSGVITAFAVQTDIAAAMLDELEIILKEDFKFSVVYEGFNSVIYRIVEDLAVETSSHLFTVPVCQSCGQMDPFATRVSVRGSRGRIRANALLCEHCVVEASGAQEARELCRMVDGKASEWTITGDTSVVRDKGLLPDGLAARLSRVEPSRRRTRSSKTRSESAVSEPNVMKRAS